MTRTARILVALSANTLLVMVQVAAGLWAHSTGLLSDAGHNVTDVVALGAALLAVWWAQRPRSDHRTFGNHRGTILVALANSALLGVVTVVIAGLSVMRLLHPRPVDGATVMIVAGVAVVVNLAAALMLHDGSSDLNLRAAALHMVADLAAGGCVLAAGVAIAVGGRAWDRADPAAALIVGLLIVVEAVRLTRTSVRVLLEAVPDDLEVAELRRAVEATPGVTDVHDLHVWSLSSEVRALSAHLVLSGHPSLEEAQEVGGRVRAALERRFSIAHSTLELECERCDDDLDDPCQMDELADGAAHQGTDRRRGRVVTVRPRSEGLK